LLTFFGKAQIQDINAYYTIPELADVLSTPDNEFDFALATLIVDKMIDPSVNIQHSMNKIYEILGKIKLLQKGNRDYDKVMSTLVYMFIPGEWNNNQIFSYDFDKLFEKKTGSIANILDTKKGNCVSMPFLFAVLCHKMNVDMKIVYVGTHYYCRWTNPLNNKTVNLELTNGGHIQRDVWIKECFKDYISEKGIETGIYMRPLSPKEAMANYMLRPFFQIIDNEKKLVKANHLSALAQGCDSKCITAILYRITFWHECLSETLKKHRVVINCEEDRNEYDISVLNEIDKYDYYQKYWGKKVKELGWKIPPKDAKKKYREWLKEYRKSKGL